MKPIAAKKTKTMNKERNYSLAGMVKSLKRIPSPISTTGVPFKITEIKKGYSLDKFEQLKDDFGTSKEKLAKITSISLATMHRRKASSGRLTSDESDRIYRLEKLYETALDVLENKDHVKAWFNTAQIVFENNSPLEYADTLPGAEEVVRVLRRMENGIIL